MQVGNTSEDPADAALALDSIVDDNGTPGVLEDDFDLLSAPGIAMYGDRDCDGLLDVGEVWTFKYKQTVSFEGEESVANTVVATARNEGGLVASESAEATLTAGGGDHGGGHGGGHDHGGGGAQQDREPLRLSDLLDALRGLLASDGDEPAPHVPLEQSAGLALVALPLLALAAGFGGPNEGPEDSTDLSITA